MEFQVVILFALIGILGAISSCVLTLAYKWRFVEWYSINRYVWMPSFCNFCFAFWISVILLGLLFNAQFPFEYIFLLAPFGAAPIARLIHEGNNG